MRCPECGTAVGYSLQGDLLRFCDPNWVDTLSKGTGTILWGIVVMVIGIVLGMVIGFASGGRGTVGTVLVTAVAAIIGWIMMTIGWWLLTQPDPSGMGEERYGTSRQIIRIALIVGIVNQLLNLLAGVTPPDSALLTGLGALQLIAGIVSVVGFYAQLIYLQKIAMRIPDDRLSGRAYTIRWGITISYGILIVFGAIMLMSGANAARGGAQPGGGFVALGCIMAIAGIGVLVFMIMYLFLLTGLNARLKESAQAARSSWAAAPWTPRAGGAPGMPAPGV
jgi:hypothetical protein